MKLKDEKLNPKREVKEIALRNKIISNKNKAAFLIGAGCSKSSQIYLGSEVTKICQKYAFILQQEDAEDLMLTSNYYNYEVNKMQIENFISSHQKEFDKFVIDTENKFKSTLTIETILEKLPPHLLMEDGKKIKDGFDFDELKDLIFWDTNYGNWFEEYSTKPSERQRLIEYLIEKKDPELAYVLLAHLIKEKYVTNIFTTNFDDLINESLMYYYNERSRVYYQDGQAYYISVDSSKPNIVKLHGDYLFQDLKNTVNETRSLDSNMRTKFSEILKTKDLIVFGYGGADNSIMSILYHLKKNENYDFSIYWCLTDTDNVNWRVVDLINNTGIYSHWVKIKSFEDFVSCLWDKCNIDPVNIMNVAEQRDKKYREFVTKIKGELPDKKTLESTDSKPKKTEKKKDRKVDTIFKSYDYYNRAMIYEANKEYQNAVDELTKAINENENYADAYFERAYMYQVYLNQKELALTDYNKAIKLMPKFPEAYNNRGILYYEYGEKGKALDDYNKSIELKPDYADAYGSRGVLYDDLGEKDKALADYNKAIELKPDYAEAYINRGILYFNSGERDKALADYNKAIELKPDFAGAYNSRGILYQNSNEKDKALVDYNKAIELKPNYAEAYENRGILYHKLGENDKALADFNKAIQLKPENISAFTNLIEFYITLDDSKNALEKIEVAKKIKIDKSQEFILNYHETIVLCMENRDYKIPLKNFENLLKENIEVDWGTDEIEDWLTKSDLSADKKKFITELTEKLKRKKEEQKKN